MRTFFFVIIDQDLILGVFGTLSNIDLHRVKIGFGHYIKNLDFVASLYFFLPFEIAGWIKLGHHKMHSLDLTLFRFMLFSFLIALKFSTIVYIRIIVVVIIFILIISL